MTKVHVYGCNDDQSQHEPISCAQFVNAFKLRSISLLNFWFFFSLTIYSQSIANADAKATKKTFVYKTINKTFIEADLFRATNDKKLNPCIIWIHGGGLIFGSRTDLPEEQLKLYLGNGYAVVSIDYRLAPETKLSEIISDVNDALNWVRLKGSDSLGIDTGRIFVIGASGGAYLALTSGYLSGSPPKAIVSFYGYGDIQSEWYSKPDSFFLKKNLVAEEEVNKLIHDSVITSASVEQRFNIYLFSRQNGLWPAMVSGHDPVNEPEWFKKYCPLRNIKLNSPPVLLIHGDKDTDVPIEQSVLLNKELELRNVKHKFIRVKNYGHLFDVFEGGLSNPVISKVFYEVIDFLNGIK